MIGVVERNIHPISIDQEGLHFIQLSFGPLVFFALSVFVPKQLGHIHKSSLCPLFQQKTKDVYFFFFDGNVSSLSCSISFL